MDLCCIRALRAEEYGRLKEFLYEAIFLPDGAQPLPREVTDDPSLRIYWEGFGREPDDRALCAEAKGQIIGAIWCRMLPDKPVNLFKKGDSVRVKRGARFTNASLCLDL